MSMLRFDHVGVVVDDLDAATAFFVGLGFEREGGTTVECEAVDKINGLAGVRAEVMMVRTLDGTGKLELVKYHAPADDEGPQPWPANRPGFRHICIEVEDLNAIVDRLRDDGFDTVGEVQDYADVYRLVYVRGPGADRRARREHRLRGSELGGRTALRLPGGNPGRPSASELEGPGVGEEGLLQRARSARRPGSVALQPHRLEPPALPEVGEGEEPLLRARDRGLEEPRPAHLPEPPGGGLDLHLVAGERLAAVLEREALGGQPQRRLAAGQGLLPVQAPVLEAGVAQRVQHPHEARGEEGAPQLLLAVAHAGHECHRRAPAASPSLAMRPGLCGEVSYGVLGSSVPGFEGWHHACGGKGSPLVLLAGRRREGKAQMIQRYPLTTFFLLAFGITWVVWVPRAAGAPLDTVGQAWTWVPAIAALLAAALTGGRD